MHTRGHTRNPHSLAADNRQVGEEFVVSDIRRTLETGCMSRGVTEVKLKGFVDSIERVQAFEGCDAGAKWLMVVQRSGIARRAVNLKTVGTLGG